MTDEISATRWYSVREASELVGLTDDAMRKRFAAGKVDGVAERGVVKIDARAIDRERDELLRRLNARDARDTANEEDASVELEALHRERVDLLAERDQLRADLITVRAIAQSLAQASAASLDASRAHLDAVQQFLAPATAMG